jgi:hypothetical protein
MPLTKGSTYENVFYEFVLDGVRDLFISEFNNAKTYISPVLLHPDNFQIKIWGINTSTEDWGANSWQKEYNVEVALYMIEKNPREAFYKQFYGDSERLFQVLHNNKTLSKTVGSTTLTWINGRVEEITYNEFEEEEEDIDGLNVARLPFSCLVERVD